MRARPRALTCAALAASLLVSACGEDPDTAATRRTVTGIVTKFAAAAGPGSCRFLSASALSDLYGRGNDPTAADTRRNRATCVKRSAKAKGAPVSITTVKFLSGGDSVKVGALSRDRATLYTVSLSRPVGSTGPWRIDLITRRHAAGA
jgi:hypothetical protein